MSTLKSLLTKFRTPSERPTSEATRDRAIQEFARLLKRLPVELRQGIYDAVMEGVSEPLRRYSIGIFGQSGSGRTGIIARLSRLYCVEADANAYASDKFLFTVTHNRQRAIFDLCQVDIVHINTWQAEQSARDVDLLGLTFSLSNSPSLCLPHSAATWSIEPLAYLIAHFNKTIPKLPPIMIIATRADGIRKLNEPEVERAREICGDYEVRGVSAKEGTGFEEVVHLWMEMLNESQRKKGETFGAGESVMQPSAQGSKCRLMSTLAGPSAKSTQATP